MLIAVQNERDRISVRRTSYDDAVQNSQLSVSILLNAEMMSRQVSQVSNSTGSGVQLTSTSFSLTQIITDCSATVDVIASRMIVGFGTFVLVWTSSTAWV